MRGVGLVCTLVLIAHFLCGQTTVKAVSSIYIKAYLGEAEASQGLWTGDRYHGELLSFDAVYNGANEGVELFWTTAVEVGSKYFAIERQQADQSFAIIQIVQAKQMSEKLTAYSTRDLHPAKGMNVYRIRQVNEDGEVNIGPTKMFEVIEEEWITFRPTIEADQIDFEENEQIVLVQVIDEAGNVVLKQGKAEDWKQVWDISSLKKGAYALRIHQPEGVQVIKFKKE